jgi:membrane-bound serine protease (ClpP class)
MITGLPAEIRIVQMSLHVRNTKGNKKKGRLAFVLSLALFFATLLFFVPGSPSPEKVINIGKVNGIISPITVEYVKMTIAQSEKDEAECLVLQVDTPGGLEGSMREIVKSILSSKVPVITYVYPEGSRATSAGAFIVLAGHVAAMAETTTIGACHPVSLGMKMTDEMKEKVTNDTVAFMENILRKRGRDTKWANRFVRKSQSITSVEAKKKGVVDIVVNTIDGLVGLLDGRKVNVAGEERVLRTKGLEVQYIKLSPINQLLQAITNPNIAYILLVLGIYALIYEFANPGIGFSGVFGAIFLILAFFAFQNLPINLAGLILILLGIIFLLLDLKVPSHGALTLGGLVAFTIGSFMLIESEAPPLAISVELILGCVGFTALFFIFALSKALCIQRKKVTTGLEALIGEEGYAKEDITKEGMVFVRGEYWSGVTLGDEIKKGERFRVKRVSQGKLYIEKI